MYILYSLNFECLRNNFNKFSTSWYKKIERKSNCFVRDENVTYISKKDNKWMMTGKSTFYEIYFNVVLVYHLLSFAWYEDIYVVHSNSTYLMKINEWPKWWLSNIQFYTIDAENIEDLFRKLQGKKSNDSKQFAYLWCSFYTH